MRIIDASSVPGHDVQQFGSVGFHVGVAGRSLHVVVARLDAGGRIPRHPAVVDQALVPISGTCSVSGADGGWHDLSTGQVALWVKGEEHETSTRAGVTALIVEGEDLVEALA
jgi:quercetin dioxygenase-like cupin family protein